MGQTVFELPVGSDKFSSKFSVWLANRITPLSPLTSLFNQGPAPPTASG